MAQSGGATGKKGEEIRPVKATSKCPVHRDEELKSYCENCKVFICIECYYDKHKSHETVLARTVVDRIKGELVSSKGKLQQRQKKADGRLDELKKQRDELNKCHAQELRKMKKRHALEVSQLDEDEDEVQQYSESLETLICEVSHVHSNFSLEAVTDLRPRMDDALAKCLGKAERQEQLLPLVRKIQIKAKTEPGHSGEMAVLSSALQDVKRCAEGQTYHLPPRLDPSPSEHYKDGDGTMEFVPTEVGQQLATLLHVIEPPVLTDVGPNGYRALTSAGKPTHIFVQLYKALGEAGSYYWVPASLPISDMVHQVTGKRPSKVCNNTDIIDIRRKTVLEWRSNSGAVYTLKYWE